MSTHANIGLLNKDGSIKSIFVWYDGYPGFTGHILKNHYNSEDKIEKLLNLGGIAQLGNTPEKIDFIDSDRGTTDFCIKLQHDADFPTVTYQDEEEFMDDAFDIDYSYLFKDGHWEVSHFGKPLELLEEKESLTEAKDDLAVGDSVKISGLGEDNIWEGLSGTIIWIDDEDTGDFTTVTVEVDFPTDDGDKKVHQNFDKKNVVKSK